MTFFIVAIGRKEKKFWATVIFMLTLLACILAGTINMANARELAVVAKGSFPVKAMTSSEIKDIFLGKKQMISGVRLKPIDQDSSQKIRQAFLAGVLNMSLDLYIVYWNNRLYQESGIPPSIRKTSEDVIAMVEQTEGAIGYIWLDEAKAAQTRVKIIFTIDVTP